jgi:hypothetical protein
MTATSDYLNRPLRGLDEVLRQRARKLVVDIAEEAGLHRCPNATVPGPAVLCGCGPGKCASKETKR